MKKLLLFALLFATSGSYVLAQVNRCSYVPPRQADNWYFSSNAGLKFSDAGVQVNNLPNNNMQYGKGSAVISDAEGNLVFYTDGMKVWNKNHDLINFGPLLDGNLGAAQPALIVPKPGNSQYYYVFTTDLLYPASFGNTRGLNYSTVDMSLNSGNGSVANLNRKLLDISAEMLTGVLHGSGPDYWVLAHGLGNNVFYSFLVNRDSVNRNPVTSSVGSVLSDDYNLREGLGTMKISPKGDKVAFASFGKSTLEVFSFDNSSGKVGSPVIFYPPADTVDRRQGPVFVEFSPDGTKLYVTVNDRGNGRDNHLYQYDLVAGGGPVELNIAPLQADVAGLQLGRDGKIYVTRVQRNMLGIIENPNRPGTACNYREDGIDLLPKKSLNGLPNFIQSFFDVPPIDYDTKCDGDETVFSILNESNIDQAAWDFGDALNNAGGTGLNPTHLFSGPGTYTVTLTETFNSQTFVTTFPVHIDSLPPKSFSPQADSLYIFPGSTIPLDAGADMFSYLWQDGSNNRYFNVSDPGDYNVEYTDIRCCTNSDTLRVIALDIKLPNAFTPDADGLNDVFKALGPTDGIQDFTLAIYNRFGQMIWEANNFDDSWDGTFNGEVVPTGIYAWNMTFNVKGNVMDLGKIVYRGSVTLLR